MARSNVENEKIAEAAIEFYKFVEANTGATKDWPIEMIVAGDYSEEFCKLMNNLNIAINGNPINKKIT